MKKIDSWYQYLSDHHLKTDDCDIFQQNPLSGCNINSRNITFSPKRIKHIKRINPLSQTNKNKTFQKNSLLKKYDDQMNDLICSHVEKILKEFGENTFLFINKIFGFVVEKGEKNPRESDSDAFISNVFKHFDQMVKMNERQLIKQKKDESKKLFSVSLLLINAKFLKLNKKYVIFK